MIWELFIALLVIGLGLVVWGFMRRGSMIVIVGSLIMIFVVGLTDEVTDSVQFVEGTGDVYVYNEVANTVTPFINGVERSIVAEYPSSSSSELIGGSFDCIAVPLAKSGSPSVATAVKVGVFDGSGAMLQQFGNNLNVTSLQATPSFFFFEFCLPEGESYTIPSVPGLVERIGVQYDAGDGSNTVVTRSDGNNPFDSTVTYRQNFLSGSWTSTTGEDLTMLLYLRGGAESWQEHSEPLDGNIRFLLGMLALALMAGGVIAFRGFTI